MIKKNYITIFVLLGVLSFNSCTSDEEISSEVPDVVRSENVYLEFNKWIYSQMNHDYLWRSDMPDSLTCDYELSPTDFYKSILSKKDRFSYCETNTSYKGASESVNLGYEYQEYELNNGSDFAQVLIVCSQELKRKGLKRGDIIIPQSENNIIVRGRLENNQVIPSDTLEAANPFEETNSVYLDSIYYHNSIKIGYICYLEFDDISNLTPVLKKFYDAQIDELILDLRYNPGGYVNTCKYLSNSIIDEKGYNEIFQQCTYNDVLTKELEHDTGMGKTISRFSIPDNGHSVLGSHMYGLNLKRIFVLTSKNSASASEAAIISMRPFMEVVLIGEKTFGKGVGSWTIKDDRYRYQLQPITMRYHNALMETTPDDGIPVDYYVPDGYSTSKKELGEIDEPLLAKAISLIIDKGSSNNNSNLMRTSYIERSQDFIREKGVSSIHRINSNYCDDDLHLLREE